MADRLKEEVNVVQRMNGFVRSPNEGIHPQPSICTEQHNFYYFHTAKNMLLQSCSPLVVRQWRYPTEVLSDRGMILSSSFTTHEMIRWKDNVWWSTPFTREPWYIAYLSFSIDNPASPPFFLLLCGSLVGSHDY